MIKNSNEEIFAILFALTLFSCGGGGGGAPIATYDAFDTPVAAPISGYNGDIMESFISRDNQYLFFNNNGIANKDIFYASHNSLTGTFTFESSISNINTPAVEGVPTLDANNNFYYVSTYNYPPGGAQIFDTIYTGTFDPASINIVNNLQVVQNLDQDTPGHLNFDVEVNHDGTVLYFVDGIFSGDSFPDVSNFVYATGSGSTFARAADSAAIFTNINTSSLEYAACISADELEFFFTRLNPATLETAIYRSVRHDACSAFSTPQRVSAITGFVEAPTLSADERTLYYHRLNNSTGKFELYRTTRP